jgi:hypothetical protein
MRIYRQALCACGLAAALACSALKFAGHPAQWGRSQREEYTAKHYHRPSDEYRPEMDFSSDAMMAKFGFALGWEALTAEQTVNWLPGDEFEAVRLKGSHALGAATR